MTQHTSKQRWGTVFFDDETGHILVREDWQYQWLLYRGVHEPWSYAQQRAIHNRLDRSVWGRWSNHLAFDVRAKSGPTPSFGTQVRIDFDIRWVLHGGNWMVRMYKMPANATSTTHISYVHWPTYSIELDTADFKSYDAPNAAGIWGHDIRAVPHEFGHTFFNDDEYTAGSPFLWDASSIMNVGREVRSRHVGLIVGTLNHMMPNLVFSAPLA